VLTRSKVLSKEALCLVVWIGIGGALAQGQQREPSYDSSAYECHVSDLPTSWGFDNAPGTIEQVNANLGQTGHASLDLRFRNTSSPPIRGLALVLEYLDSEGGIVDQVPIAGGVSASSMDVRPDALSPANSWRHALSPGDATTLVAVRDGIRTGRCPVRARITFADIHFVDGSTHHFSSSGWEVGAIPILIPRQPEVAPDLPVETPVSVLAKLKISASGNVVDVIPEQATSSKVLDWIRSRLKNWKFYSSLRDGKPIDSELTILFLIHPKGMIKFDETHPILEPVTLIQFFRSDDLFPQTNSTDKWTVMYGLLQEGSVSDYPLAGFIEKSW
jgi:hypothetical protein